MKLNMRALAAVIAVTAMLAPGLVWAGDEKVRRKASETTEDPGNATTSCKDWRATIEMTGTSDGVPLHLRVKANGLTIDYATGVVEVRQGGYLEVSERRGSIKRSFRMTENKKSYHGTFDAGEPAMWLSGILRDQTTLPDNVIAYVAR